MKVMGRKKERKEKKTIEHEGNRLGLKARPRPRPLTPGKNVDTNPPRTGRPLTSEGGFTLAPYRHR